MTVSGAKRQLDQFREQIGLGFSSSADSSKLPPHIAKALEKITTDAIAEEKMADRMAARLKEQYNETHVKALLASYANPLTKRMVAHEANLGAPAEQAAYFQALSTKPLPESRVKSLQSLVRATKADDVGVDVAMSVATTMTQAMVGDDAQAQAHMKQELENQRSAMEQSVRDGTLASMAYVYRDASDADLNAYAEYNAQAHAQWFNQIAIDVIKDSLKSASRRIGKQLAALMQSSTPPHPAAENKPAPTTPAVTQPVTPPMPEKQAAAPKSKPRKPAGNIQQCLTLEDSRAIAKCAERYR